MKDRGIVPMKGLAPAERAVKYILDVLPRHQELSWYLGPGTQMLRLLCEAEAQRMDVDPEQFSKAYCKRLAPVNPARLVVCPECGYGSDDSVCRVCGCTDSHACPGGCHWVEVDLCSACAEKAATEAT
jgi:hypothetical protein